MSLRLYHDAPLAGIVVLSDGAQNAGIEPSAAVAAARLAGVPFYAIGFGSATAHATSRSAISLLPTRAFPHDTLNVAGYLQASGYAGQSFDARAHPPPLARQRRGRYSGRDETRLRWAPTAKWSRFSFDLEPSEPARLCSSFASKRRRRW